MTSEETAKIVGLLLGLVLVILLNNWLYPNDLTRTVISVMAAP